MMFTSWVASAYATDPSESTFAASARLIGAATLALIRDIAARSGSGSPAIFSSSSLVRTLYWPSSFFLEPMLASWSGGLGDVRRLGRLGDRRGVVGQHVQRERRVDRGGDVRVDQGHGGPLGQGLSRQLVQLFAGQHLVLLVTHRSSSLCTGRPETACHAPLGALADVAGLRGLGGRNGVVGQDVERGCQVDGDRDVRVHQRHRCALGKLLAREPVELLPGEGLVSVSHPVLLLSVGLGATPRSRAAGARRATGESQTWL